MSYKYDIYVIKLKLQKKIFDGNFWIMINLLSCNLEVHKCDQRLLSMIKSKHFGGNISTFHMVLDIKISIP
jgi:hypothetical protein